MPAALLKLLWLKMRGAMRRALRVQGNPKRLILLFVGIVALVTWLAPMAYLAFKGNRTPSSFIDDFGPLLLAGFAIFSLLASSGETAIAFQPAEVDLLFPGPFTRRQLLAYKMLSGMVASLFGAVIFSIMFLRHGGSWPAVMLGFVLALWFLQFLGTGLALLKQIVGEMAYTRARRAAIAGVILAIAAGVALGVRNESFEDLPALARRLNDSWASRILLAPFRVFTSIMSSRTLDEGAKWAGVGVAMTGALALLVLRLDADYLEASIRASERHAERLRRGRAGNMFSAPAGGKPVRSRTASGAWLGGAAPIAWRQSTTLLRSGKRWALQVALLLFFAGFILTTSKRIDKPEAAMGIGLGMLTYVTLILASMLRFDFRADLDHIETLKSLPLRPHAVALGELVLPALVLGAIQAVLVVACVLVFEWPTWTIAAAAAGIPVINILLLGVENLLFLMFPARLSNRGVADFSLIGRQMLLFMGKALIFGAAVALAAGAAFGLHMVTDSWIAGSIGAWTVLAAAAGAVVYGVGRAFRAFDVSSDMPAA